MSSTASLECKRYKVKHILNVIKTLPLALKSPIVEKTAVLPSLCCSQGHSTSTYGRYQVLKQTLRHLKLDSQKAEAEKLVQ